jgi:hypothetical protein
LRGQPLRPVLLEVVDRAVDTGCREVRDVTRPGVVVALNGDNRDSSVFEGVAEHV